MRFSKVDIVFLALADIVVFFVALGFAASFFYKISWLAFIGRNAYFAIFMLLVTFLNFFFFDLYYTLKDFRRYQQIVNLILSISLSLFLMSTLAFWDKTFAVRRMFLVFFYFVVFALAFVDRVLFSLLHNKFFSKNAIVVGKTEIGHMLMEHIEQLGTANKSLGIDVVGYVSGEEEMSEVDYRGLPCLGAYDDIQKVIDSNNVGLMIFALDEPGTSKINEVIINEKLKGVDLISAIALYTAISGKIPYEYVSSSWLIEDCLRGNKFTEVRLKRAVDFILGVLLFVLSLPLIAICAIFVKLESGGPAFYVQKRIGRFSKPFKFYKLRTMRVIEEKPQKAEGWHEKNKERITRIGSFLRKYHLDELPQFLNVIKGDMSIVGPRPEMEMFIKHCENRIPFYRLRLAVKPGITGWAQVWYYHTSTLAGYKNKFKYDLYYLANLSIKLDLEIVVRTIFRIFGYPKIEPRG